MNLHESTTTTTCVQDVIEIKSYLFHSKDRKEEKKLKANVHEVLLKCVKCWQTTKIEDVSIEHLSGGMTNSIFIVSNSLDQRVLLRIYGEGTETYFHRDNEIRLFKQLSNEKIGIELLGEFQNGRFEKVIEGTTCTASMLRSPTVYLKVARKIHELHEKNIEIEHTPCLFSKIHFFFIEAQAACTSHKKSTSFPFCLIEEKIKSFKQLASTVESPIVFTHSDLQYGNIMLTDDDQVVLIDFEYSSYNPRGIDIGNFFCEWMANYHTTTPHRLDKSKYPSEKDRRAFCEEYLGSKNENLVNALLHEAEVYALGSHVFWGLWGYIQATRSTIDFNFLEYANQRISFFCESPLLNL